MYHRGTSALVVLPVRFTSDAAKNVLHKARKLLGMNSKFRIYLEEGAELSPPIFL